MTAASAGKGPTEPPGPPAAIRTSGLTKVFGSGGKAVRAVENLDLEVGRG